MHRIERLAAGAMVPVTTQVGVGAATVCINGSWFQVRKKGAPVCGWMGYVNL